MMYKKEEKQTFMMQMFFKDLMNVTSSPIYDILSLNPKKERNPKPGCIMMYKKEEKQTFMMQMFFKDLMNVTSSPIYDILHHIHYIMLSYIYC